MSELVPRKASSDAHYEALRKAYDERVKSLSRKLKGDSFREESSVYVSTKASPMSVEESSGKENLLRNRNMLADSEIAHMREEQIDTLVFNQRQSASFGIHVIKIRCEELFVFKTLLN